MDQDNLILIKELEALDNDALISIVRNENEGDVNRLQTAWEIIDKRGLKENLLSRIEQEDEAKKLSLNDLVHPENEEEISDDAFAEKIDFIIGSEIKVNQRDVLGVYKGNLATEVDLDIRKETPEEKAIQVKKLRIRLILSASSFVALLLVYAITDSFKGKVLVEWGLAAHSIMSLASAFYNYMSHKNEN